VVPSLGAAALTPAVPVVVVAEVGVAEQVVRRDPPGLLHAVGPAFEGPHAAELVPLVHAAHRLVRGEAVVPLRPLLAGLTFALLGELPCPLALRHLLPFGALLLLGTLALLEASLLSPLSLLLRALLLLSTLTLLLSLLALLLDALPLT